MAKSLLHAIVFVLVVGQAAALEAQVFNAPTPRSKTTDVQQAGGGATSQAGAVEQTGWSGIPMPKLTMPKISMPKISMPDMSSVTGPIKSGFGKVSAGSKKAWEGTKEMLSFGKDDTRSTTVNRATSQNQPSFWQRLTARNTEPQVPQTVGEFMSQPRLDP